MVEKCSSCNKKRQIVFSQRHFESGLWLGFCKECYNSITKEELCRGFRNGLKRGRVEGAKTELDWLREEIECIERMIEVELLRRKYFSQELQKRIEKRLKELESKGVN